MKNDRLISVCVMPVLIPFPTALYFALLLPSKMTCCHACLKYFLIKDHTLGRTCMIYIQIDHMHITVYVHIVCIMQCACTYVPECGDACMRGSFYIASRRPDFMILLRCTYVEYSFTCTQPQIFYLNY